MRLLLDTHVLVWYPFDRLLVSQSLCESMSLLTNDRVLAAYGPTIIVAD